MPGHGWSIGLLLSTALQFATINAATFTGKSYTPVYSVHPMKQNTSSVLKIGVLGQFSAPFVLPSGPYPTPTDQLDAMMLFYSVQAAADIINEQNDDLPGVRVQIDTIDIYSSVSLAAQGLISTRDAIATEEYAAFIGDTISRLGDESSISGESLISGQFNLPIEDKINYPTAFRPLPTAEIAGGSIADWVYAMGWKRIVLVVTCSFYDDYGPIFYPGFIQRAATLGITILDTIYVFCDNSDAYLNDWATPLQRLKQSNGRIFVLLTNWTAAALLYLQYVWYMADGITFEFLNYALSSPEIQNKTFNLGRALAPSDVNPFFSINGPVTTWPSNQMWNKFNETWSTYNLGPLWTPLVPWTGMPLAFDCALALFYGFDKILQADPSITLDTLRQGHLPRNLTSPSAFSTGRLGSMGTLSFDEYGDRLSGGVYACLVAGAGDDAVSVQQFTMSSNYSRSPDFPEYLYSANDIWAMYYLNNLSVSANLTGIYAPPADFPTISSLNEEIKALWPVVVLACVGISASFLALAYIIRYPERPRVRKTKTPLIQLLLGGIVGYSTIFCFIGPPSLAICKIRPAVIILGYSLSVGALSSMTFGEQLYRTWPSEHIDSAAGLNSSLPMCSIRKIALSINEALFPQAPFDFYIDPLNVYTYCQPDFTINPVFAALASLYLAISVTGFYVMVQLSRNPNFRAEHQVVMLSTGQMVLLPILLVPPLFSPQFFGVHVYMRMAIMTFMPTVIVAPLVVVMLQFPKKQVDDDATSYSKIAKAYQESIMHGMVYTHVTIDCLAPRSMRLSIARGKIIVLDGEYLLMMNGGQSVEDTKNRLEEISGMFAQYEPGDTMVLLTAESRFYELSFTRSETADSFFKFHFRR
ncbi:periplasmic binding protein-like I [Polychytrium aggregatum]|uniref:periplasmic binding protein-like I n=1 Tax=Polychytrium aggregatum TaxID=110093 RepID=UPI0022FDE1E9|nr:periplasmic binding protein-like I [Polychytrium aggregatum]KAI9208781.1 periplasmic binding protein-like I [Polychytrium aggregatum]